VNEMDALTCKNKGGVFDQRTGKCHTQKWNKVVTNVPNPYTQRPENQIWYEDRYYLDDRLQFKIVHKSQNTELAMMFLMQAISNRYSEKPINEYIKFMDSLPAKERKTILRDDEITKLVDTINKYDLR